MTMLSYEQTCPNFQAAADGVLDTTCFPTQNPLCKDLTIKQVLGFSASQPSKLNMLKFVQSSLFKTPVPSSETQPLTSAWNRRTTGMVGGHLNTLYLST